MGEKKITYPARWEYRIFVVSDVFESARDEVAGLLAAQDGHAELTDGGNSSTGKYRALRARAEVRSREEAEQLGRKLAAVAGVKFIL